MEYSDSYDSSRLDPIHSFANDFDIDDPVLKRELEFPDKLPSKSTIKSKRLTPAQKEKGIEMLKTLGKILLCVAVVSAVVAAGVFGGPAAMLGVGLLAVGVYAILSATTGSKTESMRKAVNDKQTEELCNDFDYDAFSDSSEEESLENDLKNTIELRQLDNESLIELNRNQNIVGHKESMNEDSSIDDDDFGLPPNKEAPKPQEKKDHAISQLINTLKGIDNESEDFTDEIGEHSESMNEDSSIDDKDNAISQLINTLKGIDNESEDSTNEINEDSESSSEELSFGKLTRELLSESSDSEDDSNIKRSNSTPNLQKNTKRAGKNKRVKSNPNIKMGEPSKKEKKAIFTSQKTFEEMFTTEESFNERLKKAVDKMESTLSSSLNKDVQEDLTAIKTYMNTIIVGSTKLKEILSSYNQAITENPFERIKDLNVILEQAFEGVINSSEVKAYMEAMTDAGIIQQKALELDEKLSQNGHNLPSNFLNNSCADIFQRGVKYKNLMESLQKHQDFNKTNAQLEKSLKDFQGMTVTMMDTMNKNVRNYEAETALKQLKDLTSALDNNPSLKLKLDGQKLSLTKRKKQLSIRTGTSPDSARAIEALFKLAQTGSLNNKESITEMLDTLSKNEWVAAVIKNNDNLKHPNLEA